MFVYTISFVDGYEIYRRSEKKLKYFLWEIKKGGIRLEFVDILIQKNVAKVFYNLSNTLIFYTVGKTSLTTSPKPTRIPFFSAKPRIITVS